MKKLLLIAICIAFALCTCGCSIVHIFIKDDSIINSDCEYYDADEMEALFYEYREDFEKTAEIVLSNDEHLKYIQENDDREIMDDRKKVFLQTMSGK